MRVHIGTDDGTIVETVEDVREGINMFLPGHPQEEFPLLKLVDPHSYAAFWPAKIPEFLAEWDRLAQRAKRPEAKEVFRKVRMLAEKVQSTPGRILRFEGDLLE